MIYTKRGCCLCDRVREQLKKLQPVSGFDWREINIEEDHDAFTRYNEEIPVVFVDGVKAFKYRLDESAFVKMLAGPR